VIAVTIQENVDAAEARLKEAFDELGTSEWLWLRDAIYGSGEKNENILQLLREQKTAIQDILGWGREVPTELVPRFVVTCLGRNLLRSTEVRRLLTEYQCSVNNANVRISEILNLSTDDSDTESIVSAIIKLKWRPSTKIATHLTETFNLPRFFAESGSTDRRPTMETIAPIRELNPLWDFQRTVHDKSVECLLRGERALIVMPTGSGKTRTSVEAVINYFRQSHLSVSGVIWMADREELCEQAFQTFKHVLQNRVTESTNIYRYWRGNTVELVESNQGLVVPGIVVTSVQQLQSRLESSDPVALQIMSSCRVLVIDEVHRNLDWNEAMFSEFQRRGINPGVLGLTATPFRRERHESGRLGRAFNFNAIAPIEGGERDPAEIARGLTKDNILARRVDLSAEELGVDISFGGTQREQLTEAIEIIHSLIRRDARSIIAFADSVGQSRALSSALRLQGITSNHLDAQTSITERSSIVDGFRAGDVRVLVNYGILTTGFDAPNADAVAIFRNTEDSDQPVIQQMIGRGLRGTRAEGGTDSCLVYIRGVN
jgi:superfamily II DNA or RNA helicase